MDERPKLEVDDAPAGASQHRVSHKDLRDLLRDFERLSVTASRDVVAGSSGAICVGRPGRVLVPRKVDVTIPGHEDFAPATQFEEVRRASVSGA